MLKMALKPASAAQELRKQRAAIDALAADNLKLKEELMLENKFSVNPTTQTAAALIAHLEAQADIYAKKITEQQRMKAELQHQVDKLQSKIDQQRVHMGGINNAAEQTNKIHRKIKILEDRLQKCNTRYNESLTRNRELRSRIDSLRRERMLFHDIYKKLQRALSRKKQEMTEIISIISESHEAREKAIILKQQVKAQAERDVANYETEWSKLTELIEQDRKQREEQRARELEKREKQMVALFKQDFQIKRRRSSIRSITHRKEDQHQQQTTQPASPAEVVKQYQQAFERVQAATGAGSVEELLQLLVAAEEANFSLFNYVNELNSEIEKLEEQISGVRREIDRYKEEASLQEDNDRAKILQEMDATLSTEKQKADVYEQKHGQAVEIVAALQNSVWDIFNRIGCNTPAVMELLGEEGVTEKNLMQYLGVIEQRTNEILQKYFVLSTDDLDAACERATTVLTGKHSAVTPVEYVMEPPSTLTATDAEGKLGASAGKRDIEADTDDDKPLDRAALEKRAQRAMAKQAEAAKIKAVRPAGTNSGKK